MRKYLFAIAMVLSYLNCIAADLLVEAESFKNKGGWVLDQQFMDIMGSPYLMAHGMGQRVEDATTEVVFPSKGEYHVYVRTFNWTSPWKEGQGPGQFKLKVNNTTLSTVLGNQGDAWEWQYAGRVRIKDQKATLALKDLMGFNGRCDAIYFTTNKDEAPPNELVALAAFRRSNLGILAPEVKKYDLIVVGGGVAGISAAVAAARLGCSVALINDRPILGGNNSSEIRVHLGGRINIGPYPKLGDLQKEFGPSYEGNAQPAINYEDHKKDAIVLEEKNITLYPLYRVTDVTLEGNCIQSVLAKQIETGEELVFEAPVFSDCTGDGTVGYLAGADYLMGRESSADYGESIAPKQADKMTMGASVQWYSLESTKKSKFPNFNYGILFDKANAENVTMGEWTWETGMNLDQINDFEQIRDYGLLVVYSNWSYLKNKALNKADFANRKLDWVAYISGKRESRRLLGDYVLKEDDLVKHVFHEDGTAATTWNIDLHYPDPENSIHFKDREFKSIAKHVVIYPYPIPYRCLYSRNIDNLFMAGRNISVTHIALGTTRVMRTTGMLGEVVGMAAYLCMINKTKPRDIYQNHLPALKQLMTQGVGKEGLEDTQNYNLGGTLPNPPQFDK